METEGSAASQLFNRLKVVYATAHKNSVDLYNSVNFSLLRKRMIGLIGMNNCGGNDPALVHVF